LICLFSVTQIHLDRRTEERAGDQTDRQTDRYCISRPYVPSEK